MGAHSWFIMPPLGPLQAVCARVQQARLLERSELRVLPPLRAWRAEAQTDGEACTQSGNEGDFEASALKENSRMPVLLPATAADIASVFAAAAAAAAALLQL